MYLPPPGPGISGRFRTIVNGLCRALGNYSDENRTQWRLVDVIFHRLWRRGNRFAALVARIEAGVPPPPPRARGAAGEAFRERVRPAPELTPPRSRAWLLRMLKHEGAHCYGQLQALLAEPEMAALIAADPRIARVLRPLWWMIGAHAMPDVLRAPPPPFGPPRPKAARIMRAVRPSPPPVAPAPPAPRPTRVPYIPGFGPVLPA